MVYEKLSLACSVWRHTPRTITTTRWPCKRRRPRFQPRARQTRQSRTSHCLLPNASSFMQHRRRFYQLPRPPSSSTRRTVWQYLRPAGLVFDSFSLVSVVEHVNRQLTATFLPLRRCTFPAIPAHIVLRCRVKCYLCICGLEHFIKSDFTFVPTVYCACEGESAFSGIEFSSSSHTFVIFVTHWLVLGAVSALCGFCV